MWNLKPLLEQNYPLKDFVFDIEIFLRFWEGYDHFEDYEEIKNKLAQCVSGYDFLLLQIKPRMTNGQFFLDFANIDNTKTDVYLRWQNLVGLLEKLPETFEKIKTHQTHEFVWSIAKKMFANHKKLIFKNQKINFKLIGNHLDLSSQVLDFDLTNHFQKMLQNKPKLELETHLSLVDYAKFLAFSELTCLKNQATKLRFNPNQNTCFLSDVVLEDFVKLISKSGNLQILVAPNSGAFADTSKFINKVCTNFAIVGESGSMTKIMSRLVNGFVGIVLIKQSHLDSLILIAKKIKPFKICYLGSPNIQTPSYFYNLSKKYKNSDNFLQNIKGLQQTSFSNRLGYYFDCPIEIINNYILS